MFRKEFLTMTDPQIIQGLIDRDERITREFFFLRCQPLVYSLIQKFFGGEADYDELVNDLYLHLMEDDARRLRMFKGNSSIYFWLKEVAKNYFMDRKNRVSMIENLGDECLLDKVKNELNGNSGKVRKMKRKSRTLFQHVTLCESAVGRMPRNCHIRLADVVVFKWDKRKGRIVY